MEQQWKNLTVRQLWLLELSSSWHEDLTWGAALPLNPGSSNVSSIGSNSSMKSSWQLTTYPWVFAGARCLKGQIIYCLACVLSFHTKQMAETQLRRQQQGSTTLPSTLSGAAVGGTQLTRAQSVSTNKILPTHTCSAEASKPCLLHYYGDLQAASPRTSSCGKVVHIPTEGSAKQFIWQRYPRLASCLQHWMNTLHSITKSCGLGTKDYSCQTR